MRFAAPIVLFLIALPLYAATPEVGKPAPAFDLPAANVASVFPDKKDATKLSLADFKGKKNVVLFFFPKAGTGGWTLESCGFRDRIGKFADLDTVVVGISTDKLAAQEAFVKKEMLTFPLLADTGKTTAKAYGSMGLAYASRHTFVIDKEGTLRKVYTKVELKKHPDEVLEFVKENLTKK